MENLPKVGETLALSTQITSNSVPTLQESKVMKNDKVIAPEMFRINPFKTSKEAKHVPNNVRANARTKPITVSQPPVITKKYVNSDSNGLSSTGIDNAKTRRPHPRSNTKNDRQCLISVNHDVCLRNYMNGKNSRGKKQKANVSIKEKQKKHQPKVKKPKTVGFIARLATPKPKKPRFLLRWSPTDGLFDQKGKIVNSSKSESQSDCSNGDDACCSKHMTRNLKLLINFVWKFMRTVCFENDHVLAILGFSNLQWGNILISRAYFVEGLGHNLFSVGQLCDSDLEVAFRRNACFVRNLEGVDLLKGDRSTNLYTINLQEMASASPICLMARASSNKSWLWHQRLSYLHFNSINDLARNDLVSGLPKFKYHKEHLCPSCEQGKSKIASHPPKPVPNLRQRLHLLHMDLCGPVRFASINGKRKSDISFLHVFGALCYPKNDREDIGKLGAKGLDLTYVPSTMTTQQPTEGELDLLFKAMYNDYIGDQPSATARTVPAAQEPQVRQTPTASTSIADSAPTPTNSSSLVTNCPNTSQDVDELNSQQHVQQQGNQAHLQSETVTDNVPNAMFDGNTFFNPFANTSTSAAESSSSQNMDPSNMRTFYQPYPHESQWTKDHPLEQVIGEPSRPVLTMNQLRSDGDMCMYALTVSTMEPKNVKEAMTDPAWIESIQEELL
uniref:Retrovirus-related Pol polyprotein from transposon TNT 1-94 n=1 Tax=Tanacetum cinerariifolium TaxID=118510 RepID=A0A699IW58_TANCI|nr:retrovirus-related Pol polyprotein from transposon TNT 1-94 [Tanacetum cinerariifolium]